MVLSVIDFAFPGIEGVRCAFGTRAGGFSEGPWKGMNISLEVGDDPLAVVANRLEWQKDLEFDAWLETKQVHGVELLFDEEGAAASASFGDIRVAGTIEADGLATHRPGRALVVKTADCQPILIAHVSGKYICSLHSGWRGNQQRFAEIGVRRFCERYDLDPADLSAVRGPSLGPAASEFIHFAAEWGDEFRPWFDQAARTVDMWTMTDIQLRNAGLKPERIHRLDLCTYTLPRLFHSFRRSPTSGRQASLVWIV